MISQQLDLSAMTIFHEPFMWESTDPFLESTASVDTDSPGCKILIQIYIVMRNVDPHSLNSYFLCGMK
jgi:hypothetical protein